MKSDDRLTAIVSTVHRETLKLEDIREKPENFFLPHETSSSFTKTGEIVSAVERYRLLVGERTQCTKSRGAESYGFVGVAIKWFDFCMTLYSSTAMQTTSSKVTVQLNRHFSKTVMNFMKGRDLLQGCCITLNYFIVLPNKLATLTIYIFITNCTNSRGSKACSYRAAQWWKDLLITKSSVHLQYVLLREWLAQDFKYESELFCEIKKNLLFWYNQRQLSKTLDYASLFDLLSCWETLAGGV